MAASARQAVDNVSAKYGVPLSRIGLTAMIGMNDVVHNVFSVDDALRTARYVKQQRLAGLQYWSFDRDRACPPGTALTVASPTCHSLPGLAPLAYQRAFARGLR
jgi:hypothetical protein